MKSSAQNEYKFKRSFFELEIKSHFSVVSVSMSMVGSVVGIGGGFVNIWELITSDDAQLFIENLAEDEDGDAVDLATAILKANFD